MVPMRTGWKNLCFTLCTTCKLYAVLFTASHSPKSSYMSRNLCVLWSLSTTGAWKIYTVCYMYGWSEIAKSKTEDNCRIWLVPCCPSVVQNRKVFPSAASFVFFFHFVLRKRSNRTTREKFYTGFTLRKNTNEETKQMESSVQFNLVKFVDRK